MPRQNPATAPQPGVVLRRLAGAGITAATASRDPAVLAALAEAGFRLGLEDAPERYSLADPDPARQTRTATQLVAVLGELGVPVSIRPSIPGVETASVALSPSATRVAAARTTTAHGAPTTSDQARPAVLVPISPAPAARR
ncbi:hypothetical protein [Streptomyces sp. CBMA123]|uniref:hypothetical protein n=1 Tax=Streptomyces sp. CBMA123 TaxID=1896313 RepID=UPI001661A09E|nr:hypothetical protein [Streptomyces sp. CBMA123]MBD0688290.1 hypothetical protein [Streptomyces sp. CBMA123]